VPRRLPRRRRPARSDRHRRLNNDNDNNNHTANVARRNADGAMNSGVQQLN